MKSITSLTVLAGLSAQATALVVSPGSPSPLDRRNPLAAAAAEIPGVLTTIPQPHSQIRLLHKQPTTSPVGNGRRAAAAGETTPSVQGGAVLTILNAEDPKKKTPKKIQSVSATFLLPKSEVPIIGPTANNPVGVYAASFWVGIDGVIIPSSPSSSSSTGAQAQAQEECSPSAASLRLGIDIFTDGTLGGEQRPFAWYQWLPRSAVGFANFTVASGDLVRLTASLSQSSNTSSGTGGTVTIENFGPPTTSSKGNKKIKNLKALQTATHTFQDAQLPALCASQGAVIVEDFPLAGLPDFPIALTNFTSIEFSDVKISNDRGESIPLDSTRRGQATVLDIYQEPQGGRLTDCEIAGRNKVRCGRVVEAV